MESPFGKRMFHLYHDNAQKMRNGGIILESVLHLLEEASQPTAWTPEEHAAAEAFQLCRDKLEAAISPEFLEDFVKALYDLIGFYEAQDFARGFRLGLELGCELWRE